MRLAQPARSRSFVRPVGHTVHIGVEHIPGRMMISNVVPKVLPGAGEMLLIVRRRSSVFPHLRSAKMRGRVCSKFAHDGFEKFRSQLIQMFVNFCRDGIIAIIIVGSHRTSTFHSVWNPFSGCWPTTDGSEET